MPKIVLFAQKTSFTDKIRKVVFDLAPYQVVHFLVPFILLLTHAGAKILPKKIDILASSFQVLSYQGVKGHNVGEICGNFER